jgi:hypothetical protein
VETGSGVSDAGQKATVETGSLAERKREREREMILRHEGFRKRAGKVL